MDFQGFRCNLSRLGRALGLRGDENGDELLEIAKKKHHQRSTFPHQDKNPREEAQVATRAQQLLENAKRVFFDKYNARLYIHHGRIGTPAQPHVWHEAIQLINYIESKIDESRQEAMRAEAQRRLDHHTEVITKRLQEEQETNKRIKLENEHKQGHIAHLEDELRTKDHQIDILKHAIEQCQKRI